LFWPLAKCSLLQTGKMRASRALSAARVRAPIFRRNVVAHAQTFKKIEGDKRIVRGKVFVCKDVRSVLLLVGVWMHAA
jgi:hypothetical protein